MSLTWILFPGKVLGGTQMTMIESCQGPWNSFSGGMGASRGKVWNSAFCLCYIKGFIGKSAKIAYFAKFTPEKNPTEK